MISMIPMVHMLKKGISVLVAAAMVLWLTAAGTAVAADAAAQDNGKPATAKVYKEGEDYSVRSDKRTDQAQIYEFFSFWCNHCYSMDPQFDVVKRHFGKRVAFIKMPVGMLGGKMGTESQMAFAVAGIHSLEAEFTAQLFDMIHVKGEIPQRHEDFVHMFTSLGVPADRFEQEFNSFPVRAAAARTEKLVEDLQIDAVPEIIVNGKYHVNMEKLDVVQDLIDIIEYLLTLP